MDFVPKSYNNLNKVQQTTGISLIDSLLKEYPKRSYDIIVDIGCGSGNITKILSQKIPHKRIIGFDINPKMIHFSKENNSSDTIEYITEDIGKPWDELSHTLKELEGKVSLVFSNQVIHFVENKENAVKNISKLLAINGNISIISAGIRDVLAHMSPEFKDNFMKIPSIAEQFETLRKYFIKYGIELSVAENNMTSMYLDRSMILGNNKIEVH